MPRRVPITVIYAILYSLVYLTLQLKVNRLINSICYVDKCEDVHKTSEVCFGDTVRVCEPEIMSIT